MSKKILSVALALIFVISTFAVSAFAVGNIGYEEDPAAYTQTWVLKAADEANADGTWDVDVYLTTTYGVGAIQFQVEATGATLTNAVVCEDAFGTDYGAQLTPGKTTGVVVIVPNPTESAAAPVLTEAKIATLTYTLTGASATVAIKDDVKTAENPGGGLIAARVSDGILTTGDMIVGQNADLTAATDTFGAAAAPAELALTSAGSTAGVIIDSNKTFGGAYAGVVYGVTATTFKQQTLITNNVEATNGGSLVVKASDGKTAASGNYGTGSTIEVLNSDGSSTGKVYVFVVFGDVDGNGLINAADAQLTLSIIGNASLAPNNSVKRLAANAQFLNNATMMHTVNANDAQAILNHVGGTKISQPNYAAKQNSFNTFYQ